MTDPVVWVTVLLLTGVISGLMAGLLGIGGGLIIVPVLYNLFSSSGIAPATALAVSIGTSLAVIVPTSVSSIRAHWKRGNIDIEIIKSWWLPITAGVFLATYLLSDYRGPWLQAFFAGFVFLVAIKMLTGKGLPIGSFALFRLRSFHLVIMPFIIGLASALVGIGGGTLTVPWLHSLQIPINRAVGTSAAIGFVISLPAATTLLLFPGQTTGIDHVVGLVHISAFICLASTAIIFAPVGAKLSSLVDPALLKKIFALVLIATGIRIILPLL